MPMPSTDDYAATVWPTVLVGPRPGTALSGLAERRLVRTVVDTHLRLPGMFTLTFEDLTGAALRDARLAIGALVQIRCGPAQADRLITGEVTAIEGSYETVTGHTIVRGYDLCHRLQRARRTRTFENVTDSDIAATLARAAGLPLGEIAPTETVYEHVWQCNQSDWDFLAQRAGEIGYEFGIFDGLFQFRAASRVGNAATEPTPLTIPGNLLRFAPRVTAGNLTPDVEVRVWDPWEATASESSRAETRSDSSRARKAPQSITQIASLFSGEAGAEKSEDGTAARGKAARTGDELGPPPSRTALVVNRLPVAGAQAAARALAACLGDTFAEAEGDAIGDPRIQAGRGVKVGGIPAQFPDTWLITNARHVFDLTESGYHTEFVASGRQDRSLLGLASPGAGAPRPAAITGLVCGIVDEIGDTRGRVKVILPWLSPADKSDWAPVVQFGAGRRSGAMFLPEKGDEVLVGFEFGDPRRPFVLGGIVNQKSEYSLGGGAVQQQPGGADASVVRRGFVSASGNLLLFHDEMGESPKPEQSRIMLGTGDAVIGLSIDAVGAALELTCAPTGPPGELTIKCGQAGTVNIVTGQGGTMTIDGGDSLTIKSAASLTIQTSGDLAVKGGTISLN